jgi:hypothetical protein
MARIVDTQRFSHYPAVRGTGGGDGGGMNGALRRLDAVESRVGETREHVSAIEARLPYLATKEEVVATKADINALETRIIRWIVGTAIASVSVAFTIAKFVH